MQNYKILNVPQMKILWENERTNTLKAAREQENTNTMLALWGGILLMNNEPVRSYYSKDRHYWEDEEGKGSLWLRHYGFAGEGYIEKNGIRRNFKAVSSVSYELVYTVSGKEKKLKVEIGTDYPEETEGAVFFCNLSVWDPERQDYDQLVEYDPDPESQLIQDIQPTVSEKGNLILDISFEVWSQFCSDRIPEHLHLEFDATYSKVTGTVTEKQKEYPLQGAMAQTDQVKALRARRSLFREDAQINARLKRNCLAAAPEESLLSIDELFCLDIPFRKEENGKTVSGQAVAQELTSETLYYLAVYYTAEMSDGHVTYEEMFGVTKEYAKGRVEDVDAKILEILSDQEVKDFLLKYAKTILGYSVASSSDKTLQAAMAPVPDAVERCRYYMSDGKHEGSMAKDPGYNKAETVIIKYAYAKLVPGLRKYYEDSGDWGRRLYEYCVKRLTMLQLSANMQSEKITHICMMLSFLDDTAHDISYTSNGEKKTEKLTYSAALYAQVFNFSLSKVADSINFSEDGKADYMDVMRILFKTMWEELHNLDQSKITEEIRKELLKELEEFGEMTQEEYIDTCLAAAEEAMVAAQSAGSLTLAIPAISKFFSNKPWGGYLAKTTTLAMYMFALSKCIEMFTDWEKLSTSEKVEAIGETVTGVLNTGEVIVRWRALSTLLDADASPAKKVNAAMKLKYGGENFDIIQGMGAKGRTSIQETVSGAGRYVGSVTADGSTYPIDCGTKWFKIGSAALRALNIILLAYVTVTLTLDLIKEFAQNRSAAILAIDTLNVISTGVSVLAEAASLVLDLAEVVCEAIPVIGAVCVIVGFVFSVVSMILKAKDQPEPPQITFIKNTIVTFIQSLAAVPQKEETA